MLNLSEVRVAINVALAAVEAEYGIKIDIGNISFGADNFKCQLTAVSGEAVSDEYSDVPAASSNGLKVLRSPRKNQAFSVSNLLAVIFLIAKLVELHSRNPSS
jgi:hypothetical protein